MYDKFAQTTHQMQFNNEFLLRKMFHIETVPIMRQYMFDRDTNKTQTFYWL